MVMMAPTTSFQEFWEDATEVLKVISRGEGQEWRNVRSGQPFEALAEQFRGGCAGEGPRKHGAVKPG